MAVSGDPVRDLCEEATCSICLGYFKDPVIIPECGHNFCRSCLIQCWEKSEGQASCPQCRETVEQSSIRRNQQLANFVEIAKKFSYLDGKKEAEGKGRMCEKHQEPLKLFCKENGSPICVVCNVSKEHKSHEVIPLEEASQEYKDQISSCLDNVRKERERILVLKADTEKESQDLLKQTDAERKKMVAEFRQLRRFLEKQEKLLLAQMAEVKKEIAAKREQHLARLSGELSSLDSLIREMEEKLQEPASELLQDIGSFLQRSQAKQNLEDPPVAFPPALKWRIWDFYDINPFLKGVMKQFRGNEEGLKIFYTGHLKLFMKDTLEFGLQLQQENVTLDPDTANPWLILSEDRKSVRRGKVRQDLPDNPERFDTYGYVLGCEAAAATAASEDPVQDLFQEATCPICLDCFRDPVIIPECGHNFCRSCLIQCWETSEGEVSCPQCRKIIQHRNLIPNRPLANVVEKLTAGKLQGEKGSKGKGKVCKKHKEPHKLFCKEDESPICVVCNVSRKHKSHEVVPLEEASQEYKNQISSCLHNVRKERERILEFKANAEKESQDLLKQTDAERKKMVAEFRRLRQFLEEQEKRILTQMADIKKEIAAKRKEHLARLSGELSSLDSLIREMEEKLQEPASELLQDIGSFLHRSQAKENLEDPPVAFPPALKWRIWDFSDMSPFLEGVMKQFSDTVEYGRQLQKENVTLDPDTANPILILSEDRKSVRRGKVRQALPDNPERFDSHGDVLGCEAFKEGRHFWEVTVGREEGWGVGVARKSVKRKGELNVDPTDGIWGMGKWDGGYKLCSPHEEPKRIRVTLNCEGGRVSFYDADTAALLHSFSEASFSGESLQPYFYVTDKGNLSLS
ncbi:E3 ubiquitin-protein ligase TRIM7-like [Zootoca vivipara]|uniref:E3 ubiquitin-protein ligase TRIM7-like n=1 Tax=Zootoca vivipara TaxID=8524 RepID=UPI00293BE37F|nr:E3 ubiquitin-protein ligase TRIM7-like [Zootoca vivipara]